MAAPSAAHGGLNIPTHDPWKRVSKSIIIVLVLAFDLIVFCMRWAIKATLPLVFVAIGIYVVLSQFMFESKDTATLANTVAVSLVAVSSLGFSWASAIPMDDPEHEYILDFSRKVMLSAMALILASGFKFLLRTVYPTLNLPWGKGIIHAVLTVLMIAFFAQAMLECFVPILKMYYHLASGRHYGYGAKLIRKYAPDFDDKLAHFLKIDREDGKGT